MTPRERVQAAFHFKETDIVPYMIPFAPSVADKLDVHYGSPDWRDKLILHVHGRFAIGDYGAESLGDGLFRSRFGYTCEYTDTIMHMIQPTFPEPDLSGFDWPDAESLGDWDALAESFRASDGFRLCGMAYGFFERAQFMRGVEDLLVDMIAHPQFVHDLLDEYLRVRLQVVDLIVERIPVEGIFGGGDDCDQRGPIMGLPRWKEFIKPRLKAVVDHVHSKGLPMVAHMCGNMAPLMDDLLEIRLDGLESLQPEAMDIYALKEKAAGKMWLIGGMGTQSTLPFGTPEEVAAETRRLISEMGRGGGYVLGPSKPVMRDVPVENAAAFVEAALDQ